MKIWAKTKEFSEGKFLVVRRDGTSPAWPHFVLGARDPAAPAALRAYASFVELQKNHDPEYVSSIRDLACDFEDYRAREGDGDPEAPPHRKDNADVILAMRGEDRTIHVRPDRKNERKKR